MTPFAHDPDLPPLPIRLAGWAWTLHAVAWVILTVASLFSPCVACFWLPGLVAIPCWFAGTDLREGSPADVFHHGLTAVAVGGFYLLIAGLWLASAAVAGNFRVVIGEALLIASLFTVPGCLLLTAGVLTLRHRRDYLAWRARCEPGEQPQGERPA